MPGPTNPPIGEAFALHAFDGAIRALGVVYAKLDAVST